MLVITQTTCRATTRLLRLDGELDFFSSFQLRTALEQGADAGDTIQTVDFENVAFVDASALSVLDEAWRILRAQGVVVEVINESARLRSLIALVGLADTFLMEQEPRPRLELLTENAL